MNDARNQPQPQPRQSPTLTTRERASLKARAHALEPVVRIGHAGLTDASADAIGRALDAHELIKVKLGEGDRDERAVVTDAIRARTGAALVQQVGRVLVLWRPRPDEDR
jgi:RNA-binding protein